jgi:hypothetical protein
MPARIWIVMGIVCLAVLGSTLDLTPPPPDPYKVEQQVDRLRAFRAELPPVSAIGYVSDLPIATTAGSAAFYAAQFALAPILLEDERNKQHAWILGNFSKQQDYAAAGKPLHLVIVKDFGNGVILFRSVAK